MVGNRKSFDEDSSKGWKTLSNLYVIVNGIILTHAGAALVKLPFTETVAQLSCGMNHCVAKTSLRKVFTWGDNQCGQLGHGHFRRMDKPKLVEFVPKNILTIN